MNVSLLIPPHSPFIVRARERARMFYSSCSLDVKSSVASLLRCRQRFGPACKLIEVTRHARRIGRNAREQLDRAYGLVNRHATAVERAAAKMAGRLEQRRLQR